MNVCGSLCGPHDQVYSVRSERKSRGVQVQYLLPAFCTAPSVRGLAICWCTLSLQAVKQYGCLR